MKKLLALLLSALLIFSACGVTVFADDIPVFDLDSLNQALQGAGDGDTVVLENNIGMNSVTGLEGEGTQESPYLISTLDELRWFRDDVNGGNEYVGKYVALTADINLNNENWTPIGYKGKTFKGTFDGGDNTIKNLYCVTAFDNSSANNGIGLFGRTDDPAVIKNLTIENATVLGSLYVGAVVGYGYTGKAVENVTVKGEIKIDAWWYAGVIGGNGYMSLVNNCHVIAEDGSYVKGNNGSYIGGIWGFRGEGNNKITNCTVKNLDITGVDRVGGICGIGHYGNTVADCAASNVTVTATDPEATTVGLIVGACQGTDSEPTNFDNNTVEDVTVTVGGEVIDAPIYGTNINGSTAVTNYVATVGGNAFADLQAAIDAAQNGETVVLLSDIEITNTVKVIADKKITLDLNGHTIDGTEKVKIALMSYGDLTLKDSSDAKTGAVKAGVGTAGNAINICSGTFTLESGNIYSKNNAILVDENVTKVYLKGGKIIAEKETKSSAALVVQPYNNGSTEITISGGEFEGYFGILLSKNIKLDITGGTITGVYGTGLQGNGTYDTTEINISGGVITGNEAAIYHPQNGVFNITGGEFTGKTGVVVKSGKVTISGGNISATGEAEAYVPTSSGFKSTGDALYVEHYDNSTNSSNYGTPVVTVTGGTFTSANGKAVGSYAKTENAVEALTEFISGGTFNTAVDEAYCADGFVPVDNGDGTYGVNVTPPSATVTDIDGATLKAAGIDLTFAKKFVADAATDVVLAVYGDWYADFVLTVNKDVTFNANGGADGYLAGQYDAWSENWIPVPFENVTLKANEPLKIMEYAAKLMNKQGLKITYADVYNEVKEFDCGVYFTPEFLAANPDVEATLELRIYNPNDESISIVIHEEEKFTVENAVVYPPSATVTDIDGATLKAAGIDLTFAKKFVADAATDVVLAVYGDWYADFVLTVNKDVTFNANGGADGYLAGQYDAWSENWIPVPFEDVTLKANEPLKIMEYAAKLMNKQGLKITYADVYNEVKEFDCGVYFTPEFLAANPDVEATLELRIYNPNDESISIVIHEEEKFTVDNSVVYPPVAIVEDIELKDLDPKVQLTFAKKFIADEVDANVLATYKDWYADFVLTVNKDVTFNANGGADGYLAGQYDEWSENWVSVPFENVTLKANEPLKIMEYAAKLMNKQGLKLTVKDVYEFVKEFDCGVYFTPEFLVANPDLVVTLELRIYNPVDESISVVIHEAEEFTPGVALVNGYSYKTFEDAIVAANTVENATVVLLKDVTVANFVTINKGSNVTIDLNGHKVTGTDTTEKNFGLIQNNGTLTINDTVGTGSISLTATVNSGWNRYSAVVSNNPGGTLVVNGGTLEHLGGTDMAYGIDSLTNGGIGDVSVTINGGTVTSVYRAIRQFLNSDSKQNILTVNGGTLKGDNKSIFFHDPSTKANNGTVTVSADAEIYGDVYLFVTENSATWPVDVSIAAAALQGESAVVSKNVPDAYSVENVDGIYGITTIYGDVNLDGEVNILDYIALSKAIANEATADEEAADLNVNGEIEGNDLVILKKLLLGLTVTRPVK